MKIVNKFTKLILNIKFFIGKMNLYKESVAKEYIFFKSLINIIEEKGSKEKYHLFIKKFLNCLK